MLDHLARVLAVVVLAAGQAPPEAPPHAPVVLQESLDVEAARRLRVDVGGVDVAVVGPLGRSPASSSEARILFTTSEAESEASGDAAVDTAADPVADPAADRAADTADRSARAGLQQRGWTIEVVEGEFRIIDGAVAVAADEPAGTEAGDHANGAEPGAAVAGAESAAEAGAAAADAGVDAAASPPPRPILRIWLPLSLDVDVTTRGGAISVDGIEASVRLRSHGGVIRLGHVRGSAIDVDSAGGTLQAGRLEGEHVRLASAAGRLDVGASTAPVVAESTSGDIVLRVTGTGEIDATSDSGHVVVGLAGELADLAARLDVQGGQVVLGKGLPLEAFLRKTEASGKVGPGGPRLRAHSATGCALVGTVRNVETWVRQGVLERGCGVVSQGS